MTVELAEQQRAIAVARESESAERRPGGRPISRGRRRGRRRGEGLHRPRSRDGRAQEGHRTHRHRTDRRARCPAPDERRRRPKRTPSAGRGAAVRAQAEADADADKIKSMAMRVRAEIEAEALKMMNDAHNMLSPEARMSALRMRLVEKAEGIIRESVRPMERIEGIKILHVDGLGGSSGGGSNGVTAATVLAASPTAVVVRLGAALSRPGAARRSAAARDRPRRRRHPAPRRRRQRRPGRLAAGPDLGRAEEGLARDQGLCLVSVIDASADTVWSRIRDFNALPQWHPGIADSRIENGRAEH